MLFKSFLFYKITKQPTITSESAQNALSAEQDPIHTNRLEQMGWMSPFGYGNPNLTHTIGHNMLLCAERTQKLLPASIVNQAVNEQVSLLANQEGRKISKREKMAIRESIYGQFLSKALLKKSHILAYFDFKNNYLILGTTNKVLADMFLDLLFKTFSGLCVARPETILPIGTTMTGWLKNDSLPPAFTFANDCEVFDLEEKQSQMKFKGFDLQDAEILTHLTASRQIKKLAFCWQNKLLFTLNQDLSIAGIKFLDLLQEQRSEISTESHDAELDADFAITTDAFSDLIADIIESLGGLVTTASSAAELDSHQTIVEPENPELIETSTMSAL